MSPSNQPGIDRKSKAEGLRGTVLRQLAALSKMKVPELREKWHELNGEEPPPAFDRRYLVRRLAYRIQEMYYGGLSENAERRLREIAQSDPLARAERSGTGKKPDPSRPIAGTRFKRRWRGLEYEVVVVEGGFEYGGQVYRSLTAVALAITGTKWNGRVFFGLGKQGSKQESGVRDQASGKKRK